MEIQKNLGLKLNKQASFKDHLKDKLSKVNRGAALLKIIERILTAPFISYSLLILYTASPT